MTPTLPPVFIGWTRSFLFSFLGILTLLMGDAAAVQSFIYLFAPLFGIEAEAAAEWFTRVTPAVLFMAAMLERSGAFGQPRPYSLNPKDT